ncbi:hypothetical protein U8335_04215 [Roseiconus lacunae]|uniref:hypothetical protein n=1 Tax=Roseiconus lacunae TaxID=2605694 RepID=UPI0030891DEE|nr:hypothetical protein U8335_04215 [Stieleria sp. HD01]
MSSQQYLERRLSDLEREARVWRRIGLGALVSVVLFSAVAATHTAETPEVVRAKEFQLVGNDGKIRGAFRILGTDNVQLRMYGAGSEVALVANDQRAILHLINDQKSSQALIEAYGKGGAIALSRANGQDRASVQINGGSAGSFVLVEPTDGPKVQLPE